MLRLEEIFSAEELTDEEKAERALKLFYGCIPEPLEEAVIGCAISGAAAGRRRKDAPRARVQRSRRFIPLPMMQG